MHRCSNEFHENEAAAPCSRDDDQIHPQRGKGHVPHARTANQLRLFRWGEPLGLLRYHKEFDRLDARRSAPQEGVPPVTAGEADTISANRCLSFLMGFRDAAGRMSTDVRNWHVPERVSQHREGPFVGVELTCQAHARTDAIEPKLCFSLSAI